MFEDVRRLLEPTACQVFPINFLYLPLIYWLFVFLYCYFTSPGDATLRAIIKISTIQMFKNGFYQNHPSAFFAGPVLMVLCILEYVCAFPITTP